MSKNTQQQSRTVYDWSMEEIKAWEKKQGVTGYDILRMEGCPYTLPRARSMTQAGMDYYHNMPKLIHWYSSLPDHDINKKSC